MRILRLLLALCFLCPVTAIVTTSGSLCYYNCSESHCSDSSLRDVDDCIVSSFIECDNCYDYVGASGVFSAWITCDSPTVSLYEGSGCWGSLASTATINSCFVLEDDVSIAWADCSLSTTSTPPPVDSTAPSTTKQGLAYGLTAAGAIVVVIGLLWLGGAIRMS